MNAVFDNVVGIVVRLAILDAGFDTAAGKPCCKAATVMIATVIVLGQFALRIDRAAEFAAADY